MQDVKLVRIGLNFFGPEDIPLEMMGLIPDGPLIGVTFIVKGSYIAYTPENEPKLARKYERQLRKIKEKVAKNHQEYLEIVSESIPDEIDYHLKEQGALVKELSVAITTELTNVEGLDLKEISLMGNWPLYQTEDADLSEEDAALLLQQMEAIFTEYQDLFEE